MIKLLKILSEIRVIGNPTPEMIYDVYMEMENETFKYAANYETYSKLMNSLHLIKRKYIPPKIDEWEYFLKGITPILNKNQLKEFFDDLMKLNKEI